MKSTPDSVPCRVCITQNLHTVQCQHTVSTMSDGDHSLQCSEVARRCLPSNIKLHIVCVEPWPGPWAAKVQLVEGFSPSSPSSPSSPWSR